MSFSVMHRLFVVVGTACMLCSVQARLTVHGCSCCTGNQEGGADVPLSQASRPHEDAAFPVAPPDVQRGPVPVAPPDAPLPTMPFDHDLVEEERQEDPAHDEQKVPVEEDQDPEQKVPEQKVPEQKEPEQKVPEQKEPEPAPSLTHHRAPVAAWQSPQQSFRRSWAHPNKALLNQDPWAPEGPVVPSENTRDLEKTWNDVAATLSEYYAMDPLMPAGGIVATSDEMLDLCLNRVERSNSHACLLLHDLELKTQTLLQLLHLVPQQALADTAAANPSVAGLREDWMDGRQGLQYSMLDLRRQVALLAKKKGSVGLQHLRRLSGHYDFRHSTLDEHVETEVCASRERTLRRLFQLRLAVLDLPDSIARCAWVSSSESTTSFMECFDELIKPVSQLELHQRDMTNDKLLALLLARTLYVPSDQSQSWLAAPGAAPLDRDTDAELQELREAFERVLRVYGGFVYLLHVGSLDANGIHAFKSLLWQYNDLHIESFEDLNQAMRNLWDAVWS